MVIIPGTVFKGVLYPAAGTVHFTFAATIHMHLHTIALAVKTGTVIYITVLIPSQADAFTAPVLIGNRVFHHVIIMKLKGSTIHYPVLVSFNTANGFIIMVPYL